MQHVHDPDTRPRSRAARSRLPLLLCLAALGGCGDESGSEPPVLYNPGGTPAASPATTTGTTTDAVTGDTLAGGDSPGASPAGAAGTTGGTPPASGDGAAPDAADDSTPDDGTNPAGDDTPADDGSDTPVEVDEGVGDGSDVVTMGDSWMNYALSGGGIEGGLRRAGKSYRGYGVAATTLSGSIPGQYDRAKAADPNIATVIMTGGGNDIMFSGGCNTEAACEASVQMIVDQLDVLWTKMADDGVKDVIYVAYAAGAGTTPDSTRPKEPPPPPSICLTGRITCHSLQTTDLVMDSLVDGIHPTPAANDRIAAGLLELMEAEGIRR